MIKKIVVLPIILMILISSSLYPLKVKAAEPSMTPVIPIAEAILAYILGASAGVASESLDNDSTSYHDYGSSSSFDLDFRDMALLYASYASQEVKQAAYDAWDSAYKAGENLKIPDNVKNWMIGYTVPTILVGSTPYETVLENGLTTRSLAGIETTGYGYRQKFATGMIKSNEYFMASYKGKVRYYKQYVTDLTYYNYNEKGSINLEAMWQTYENGNYEQGYDYFDTITDSLSLSSFNAYTSNKATIMIAEMASLKVVDFEKVANLQMAAVGGSFAYPSAIPAPMPKDFIVQGEGSEAKPIGFPITKSKVITNAKTGEATKVIATPIGDTLVNTKTGEVVGDIAVPVTPPLTFDPPDKSLSNMVTTRFPFSLPWDVYRVVSVLSASPVTPVINVNQNFMGMPFKFTYSFGFLDPYMPWFRSFILIGFVVWLISITRSLLGGAK